MWSTRRQVLHLQQVSILLTCYALVAQFADVDNLAGSRKMAGYRW
jgi:hypothetical protein